MKLSPDFKQRILTGLMRMLFCRSNFFLTVDCGVMTFLEHSSELKKKFAELWRSLRPGPVNATVFALEMLGEDSASLSLYR